MVMMMLLRRLAVLLLLPACALAQAAAPPDTAALGATFRNPARPDTVRLWAGLQLLRVQGTDAPALRRREALGRHLLAQARRLGHPRLQMEALTDLRVVAEQKSQWDAELGYSQQMVRLAQQQHNPKWLAEAYYGLAGLYFNTQNIPEARRYAELADALLRRYPMSLTTQSSVLSLLVLIYLEQHEPALARQTFRRALPVVRRLGQPLHEFNLLASYASGLRLTQPDSALRYLKPALALAQRLADPYALAYAHLVLMQTRKTQRRWADVQAEARLTIGYARRSEVSDFEAEALADLAESLRHLGRSAAAYDTLRLAHTLLDTLESTSAKEKLTALQMRFGTERQQAQIRRLEQDRRLASQARELARLRTRQQLALVGGGAALLLLLAGGLLWRYRRRQAARDAALRNRIAADLHDDVGSLLTQISLESELLREGLYAPHEQYQQLGRLADVSRTAVRHLNDVVWGLDARHDSMADLLDRLRDHAYEVLSPKGLDIDFAVGPGLAACALPLPARQGLYLIYKEALHNLVKYAHGARLARVQLALDGNCLVLTVADDGTTPAAPRPAGSGGHGLGNMASRAAAAGGTVRCGPGPEGGWVVEARLPVG